MSGPRRAWLANLLPGLGLALAGGAASLTSPFVEGLAQPALVFVSIVLPFAAAAAVRARFPQRPVLGHLLGAVGVVYFVRSLAAVDNGVLYTAARALGQFSEVFLVWLILAFPTGALVERSRRALVLVGALSIVLLWWPTVALSRIVPMPGIFSPCGSDCPDNVVLVADSPGAAHVFTVLFRSVAVGILLITALVLWTRLRRSTPIIRRVLAPVLAASIARVVAIAALHFALGSPAEVRVLLVATYWAIPASIVVGLLRARAYDAGALARIVHGVRTQPAAEHLEAAIAEALGDETLEIAHWLPDSRAYAGREGLAVALPDNDPTRAVTRLAGANGEPIAALIHDSALLDHPELLDAVGSIAATALETKRLEAALTAARAGTVSAVETERRRIERDLHDGAQQRLVALQIKLALAERELARDAESACAVLGQLGRDVDATLLDVRALAHGIAPPVLVERGLPDALRAAARDFPIHVRVEATGIGRYGPEIENAVYLCCREALQNVAKHAGEHPVATVELQDSDETLTWAVVDDGAGFDLEQARRGAGLSNMSERMEELGGSMTIAARPGGGTSVRGSLPIRHETGAAATRSGSGQDRWM